NAVAWDRTSHTGGDDGVVNGWLVRLDPGVEPRLVILAEPLEKQDGSGPDEVEPPRPDHAMGGVVGPDVEHERFRRLMAGQGLLEGVHELEAGLTVSRAFVDRLEPTDGHGVGIGRS